MKNLNMKRAIGTLVILVIVGLLIFVGISKWQARKEPALNGNSFYAVFLTNDQVYFGHLSKVDDNYLSLTNIYYLQLKQPLQATSTSTDSTTVTDQSKLSLIKLGKEIHGPKDEMQINRQNVLFYEELNDSSQVVQTIKNSK